MNFKRSSLFWEVLNIVSSVIMIIFLIIVLFFSFRYFTENYPNNYKFNGQMFYVAVGICIATILSQWIQGRMESVIKSFEVIKIERRILNYEKIKK